jgi:hypothetical protein
MKKTKRDVAKMVDTQAKGKKVRGAATDAKTPDGRDLDVRASKVWIKLGD